MPYATPGMLVWFWEQNKLDIFEEEK